MAAFNNSELSGPGIPANNHDWVFQWDKPLEPFYDGDFDTDIAAIMECSGYDSGYFSNEAETVEASNTDFSSPDDQPRPAGFELQAKLDLQTIVADTVSFNKPNHNPTYAGNLKNSITQPDQTSLAKHRKQTQSNQSLHLPVFEKEQDTAQNYSATETPSHPLQMQQWASTDQRHERTAYRLAKPADFGAFKKRKARGAK